MRQRKESEAHRHSLAMISIIEFDAIHESRDETRLIGFKKTHICFGRYAYTAIKLCIKHEDNA